MSGDVTILLACGDRTIEVTAMSLIQAKQRIAAAWTSLFEPGPEKEAAAFEVIMTEVAETYGAAK
jgi:hypothetical protein